MINQFANALLNTKGGILVFGVDPKTCKYHGIVNIMLSQLSLLLKLLIILHT